MKSWFFEKINKMNKPVKLAEIFQGAGGETDPN